MSSFTRIISLVVIGFMIVARTTAATRDERVFAAAERAKPAAIELLQRLVSIDTGTGHGPGIDEVGRIVADELTKFGATVELVASTPLPGKNIVATFTGSGTHSVLLVAHMDTVWPVGEAAKVRVREAMVSAGLLN